MKKLKITTWFLLGMVCVPLGGYAQSSIVLGNDRNYIVTTTPTERKTVIDPLSRTEKHLQTVHYFDGLGRSTQLISVCAGPLGEDLVVQQEYDDLGRESKTWLTTPVANNIGRYVVDVSSKTKTYYNDQYPYAKKGYENSPLNRVSEQYGPGQSWYNNNRAVRTTYKTNESSGNTVCALYSVSGANDNPTLTKSGNYASGQLHVTVFQDEDGRTLYEFKNKLGQIVLTRQLNGSVKHDTYQVYDKYGNKTFVLPPVLSDSLTANTTWPESNPSLQRYAYLYRFDEYNRMIAKRLPGTDWQYFVYDMSDRLVLSQDGEQRIQKEWVFYKYDVMGRVILSGMYTSVTPHQNYLNFFKTTKVVESRGSGVFGYTSTCLPIPVANKVMQVNYYDDYNYMLSQNKTFFDSLSYTPKTDYGERYMNSVCDTCSAKGLLTGTRVKVLNSTEEIVTAMYYDYKGNLVQKKSTNHLGGCDREYYAYTFTGLLTKRLLEHTAPGKASITELYTYFYDSAGRLTDTKHQLNKQPEVLLSKNEYDELGRVKKNSSVSTSTIYSTYTYNVRSWLSGIDGNTLYLRIGYNESVGTGSPPQFNGNISSLTWTSASTRRYEFKYDDLSRLVLATYSPSGSSNPNLFSTEYAYDKQGNITKIYRQGAKYNAQMTVPDLSTYVDMLTLSYNGNQLKSVSEVPFLQNVSGSYDFKYYSSQTSAPYAYNLNGALTQDLNKGITGITYNFLHLPQEMAISHSTARAKNTYTYSADGQKLRVLQRWDPTLQAVPIAGSGTSDTQLTQSICTDYVGNKVYENNNLKYIFTENGFIEGGQYYFYIKDHLGNNRVVMNQTGVKVQQTDYYPFGLPMVESTNPGQQPYKFGDKEFDTMHGLNWYDFFARYYDAALARFMTIDPLCEKYYSVSPYAYCLNNPVKYIDPNGEAIIIFYANEMGEIRVFIFTGDNEDEAPRDKDGNIKDKFLADFFQAYNYNIKNGGGKNLYEAANNNDLKIRLMQAPDNMFVAYEDGRPPHVQWDPDFGLRTIDGYVSSPATALEHEMDHAVDYVKYPADHVARKEKYDKQYYNAEERRVMTGSEATTAQANGEFPNGYVNPTHTSSLNDYVRVVSPIRNSQYAFKRLLPFKRKTLKR